MSQQFKTLVRSNSYELIVKKSRFVVCASRCDSPDEAMAFLLSVQQPEATHNCWAYKIGDQYRFSDDGEPGGTAGRPIYSAIQAQGLDHVMVVVTRYFGGIKLGAGGLVRAYAGAASQCLREAESVKIAPVMTAVVHASFEDLGQVYTAMQQCNVQKTSEIYTDKGVELTVTLQKLNYDVFCETIKNSTRGRGRVVEVQ